MALRFQRLTRPAIRAMDPGQRIHEHGISAERLTTGDVRYSVNVMVDGARVHRVIGRESEGVTREQAERAIEALRTKARESRLDLPTGRKTLPTFAAMVEDYLGRIEHHPKHGRNLDRKRRHLRERILPHFRSQRPDKLTSFAVSGFIKARREQGAADATINRELASLNHFLARAIEYHWIKTKPKIPKFDEARKKITILAPADQSKLFAAAKGDQDPLTWLFVAVALGTGMRHSEILRIRWEEIDFTNRRIHVPVAKAGQREQPMPPALADLLAKEREQLGGPDGWLFPTTRADAKNPHRTQMAEQFRRAVVRAKLDPAKVTPHVLRHTAITALVKAGVDLPTIQKISGHKTLAMVLRYTTIADDHVDASMEKLDAAFSGTVTQELHTAPMTGTGKAA